MHCKASPANSFSLTKRPVESVVRSARAGLRAALTLLFVFALSNPSLSQANTVLDFDGVDDYLSYSSASTTIDFDDRPFSIEMWVKATLTGSKQTLLFSRSAGTDDVLELSITDIGSPQFTVTTNDGISRTVNAGVSVADGNWHHLAAVRRVNSSSRLDIEIFIDGVKKNSRSDSISSSDRDLKFGNPVSIGASYDVLSNFGDFFSGQLDELRIWDTDRTAFEISSDYESALIGNETDLSSYVSFEQGVPNGNNLSTESAIDLANTRSPVMNNFARSGDTSNFVSADIPSFVPSPRLALLDQSKTVGDAAFSMVATSLSSGAIVYTGGSAAVATIDRNTGAATLIGAGSVTITATQSAGDGYTGAVVTARLRVKSSNSVPTLSGAPASVTVLEDTQSAIDLSGVALDDPDITDYLTLTISTDSGTLSAPPAATSIAATRTSATEISLHGLDSNINSYLDSAVFTYLTALNANGSGVASLSLTVSDGSSSTLLATISIDSTDTAEEPVLDASESPSLSSINKNAGDDDGSSADDDDDATNNTNNPGTSIADIIVDGSITDLDAVGGAIEAMAVTAVDNTNGVWQYSTDNGSSWSNFSDSSGEVSLVTASRLLDGSASGASTNKIRYVPALNSTDSATFTFRAWDKASGTLGGTADTTSSGATTAFSSVTDTASLSISGGNAFPEASGIPSSLAFIEDTLGAVDLSAMTLSDTDDDTLTLTLSVDVGSFSTPVDVTGVTETRVSATQLTLEGSAANLNSYLDTATRLGYSAAANANGSAYATLSLTLYDGTVTRSIGTSTINVTAVNDAPVLNIALKPARQLITLGSCRMRTGTVPPV